MATGKTAVFVGQLRGKVGSAVFVRRDDGTFGLRQRTFPNDPHSPAQQAQRQRMTAAGHAWRALKLDQKRAWGNYADSLGPQPTPKGGMMNLSASGAFTRLTLKFLEVNPTEEPPKTPPETAFVGDGVVVSVDAEPGSGQIRFTASGPNSPDVVTELLVQKLPSAGRKPLARGYRASGFVAFTPESLTATVDIKPGPACCAFRFVRASTGQSSAMVVLDEVEA